MDIGTSKIRLFCAKGVLYPLYPSVQLADHDIAGSGNDNGKILNLVETTRLWL